MKAAEREPNVNKLKEAYMVIYHDTSKKLKWQKKVNCS